MNTFLFDAVVFGPVKSRRLGISLGINLLPLNRKYCNFDCIYCECGLNANAKGIKIDLPSRMDVYERLKLVLSGMVSRNEKPDYITFAGNGEPTMHPEFTGIIEDTLLLRDEFCSSTKVSVLSNATMLANESVVKALRMVDQNILKLDSAFPETIALINRPVGKISVDKLIEQFGMFSSNLVVQTLFVRGTLSGITVNNTTEREIQGLIEVLGKIMPSKVMIYTIDRNTPYDTLEKVKLDELQLIAKRFKKAGVDVQVSG